MLGSTVSGFTVLFGGDKEAAGSSVGDGDSGGGCSGDGYSELARVEVMDMDENSCSLLTPTNKENECSQFKVIDKIITPTPKTLTFSTPRTGNVYIYLLY